MERATRTRIGFITRSRVVVGSLLAGMALLIGTTSSPVLASHYSQFAVARYTPGGSLGSHFHDDGKLVTDFDSGSMEGARAMAIQADGYIVVAGFSE